MTLNFLTKRKQNPGSKSLLKDLKKLISVPSAVLFFGVAVTGLQWGVHDTFLFVYFQKDLKASTALVSYMVVVGSLSVFLSLFFINKIIDCIGTANAIFLHIIVEAGRMMVYSYIKETPPYFALGLAATGKSLSEALLFAEHRENMFCTKMVLIVRNNFCTKHVFPRFELGIFMY